MYSRAMINMPPEPTQGSYTLWCCSGLIRRTIMRTTDAACRTRRPSCRRVGELADQVFVGGAEQVRELEVLVAQAVLAEVGDELAQLDVGDLALAHLAAEVDVLQHLGQAGVVAFQMPRARLRKPPTSWCASLTR